MPDHIYILHYTPLTQRKEYLLNKFKELNITNYTFYEEYNRDVITPETIEQYYKLKEINKVQICITISHLEIYRKMIQEGHEQCLILEDDAILSDDFNNKLKSYMETLPSDYNLAFLVDGCGMHSPNIVSDKIWYPAIHSRTCCAYIINKKTCELLLEKAIPFTNAIDHELNKQIADNNLIVYWCEPTIVHHGSDGNYSGSYSY